MAVRTKKKALLTEDGLIAGEFSAESGIWLKKVTRSVHFVRSPASIAIDASNYIALRDKGILKEIRIFDRESGDYWRIAAEDFEAKRIFLDRGHGKQYCVGLAHWVHITGQLIAPLEPLEPRIAVVKKPEAIPAAVDTGDKPNQGAFDF